MQKYELSCKTLNKATAAVIYQLNIPPSDRPGLAFERVHILDQLGFSAVLGEALVLVDDDLLHVWAPYSKLIQRESRKNIEELPALPRASEVDGVFGVLDEDAFVLDGAVVATAVVAVAADLVTVTYFNSNSKTE